MLNIQNNIGKVMNCFKLACPMTGTVLKDSPWYSSSGFLLKLMYSLSTCDTHESWKWEEGGGIVSAHAT